MNYDPLQERLAMLLEELASINGVRGAVFAVGDVAYETRGTFSGAVAADIAKTVRRMAAATDDQALTLTELNITLGGARLLVMPITFESAAILLLERDTAVAAVRTLLAIQLQELQTLLSEYEHSHPISIIGGTADDTDQEIERVKSGELRDILIELEQEFSSYAERLGRSSDDAHTMLNQQMHEWLMCCNPSAYTLPLLVDGLGQALGDDPNVRAEFMDRVQATVYTALSNVRPD